MILLIGATNDDPLSNHHQRYILFPHFGLPEAPCFYLMGWERLYDCICDSILRTLF